MNPLGCQMPVHIQAENGPSAPSPQAPTARPLGPKPLVWLIPWNLPFCGPGPCKQPHSPPAPRSSAPRARQCQKFALCCLVELKTEKTPRRCLGEMQKPEVQRLGTNKESLERRTQERIKLDDQKLSNKELRGELWSKWYVSLSWAAELLARDNPRLSPLKETSEIIKFLNCMREGSSSPPFCRQGQSWSGLHMEFSNPMIRVHPWTVCF